MFNVSGAAHLRVAYLISVLMVQSEKAKVRSANGPVTQRSTLSEKSKAVQKIQKAGQN